MSSESTSAGSAILKQGGWVETPFPNGSVRYRADFGDNLVAVVNYFILDGIGQFSMRHGPDRNTLAAAKQDALTDMREHAERRRMEAQAALDGIDAELNSIDAELRDLLQ